MPDTFTSRVVCHPLIKVSVNICVIVSDFTRNSSGLQQRRLLSKCIYLLSSQAVNVKFIQQSSAKTSQMTKLALLLLQILPYRCHVDTFVQIVKSNKLIINSLKTVVEQQNSVFYWKWSKVYELILWQQIFHSLSSVRKKAGLKSSIIIFFTHFHEVELDQKNYQRKPFYLVRASKRQRRNRGYPYW